MIKIIYISILILLNLSFTAFSQDFDYHRDFQKIRSLSKDSSSSLYYPRLLQRFQKNEALIDAELLALHIGFTSSQYYTPYKTIKEEKRIIKLVQEKKYKEALELCDRLLTTNPLSLTALINKEIIHQKIQHDSLHIYRARNQKLINALLTSGDGSLDKPYYVLGPLDGQLLIEHSWMGKIGSTSSGRDQHDYFIDILEHQKEGEAPKLLHFNIAHAVARMFTDEERADMEKVFDEAEDVLGKKKPTKN